LRGTIFFKIQAVLLPLKTVVDDMCVCVWAGWLDQRRSHTEQECVVELEAMSIKPGRRRACCFVSLFYYTSLIVLPVAATLGLGNNTFIGNILLPLLSCFVITLFDSTNRRCY
jgi:hypothetical protein